MDNIKRAYIADSSIITALGNGVQCNVDAMLNGLSGVNLHSDSTISAQDFYSARIDDRYLESVEGDFTRFEKLIINAVRGLTKLNSDVLESSDTLFVFSTTKGNIDQLSSGKRIKLFDTCVHITNYFGNSNKPLVISNACISGTVALIMGKRLIESGSYKNVLVLGADMVSSFVLSGFQSFKALSEGACKPFDANRTGLSLGEGAAAVWLSAEKHNRSLYIAGGGISNDANHISGPSRTGDGLFFSIEKALNEASNQGIEKDKIGYISAHGTATSYNDEMEAKAINSAGLNQVPINSLKAYIGHTLGAAGLIESIIGMYSMENNILIPSLNYSEHGVSVPLNIIVEKDKINIPAMLKTSSGFGGCNAALVIGKE
jgi:3-oxoacyl-[acyl-carrier-protein] synthase-1